MEISPIKVLSYISSYFIDIMNYIMQEICVYNADNFLSDNPNILLTYVIQGAAERTKNSLERGVLVLWWKYMDEWGLFVNGYLPYFSFSSHHGLEKITSRICCDGVFREKQVFVIATQTVFRRRFTEQQRCLCYKKYSDVD